MSFIKFIKRNKFKELWLSLCIFFVLFLIFSFLIYGKEQKVDAERIYKRFNSLSFEGFNLGRSKIDYDIDKGTKYYVIDMSWLRKTETQLVEIRIVLYVDTSQKEAEEHANYAYKVKMPSSLERSYSGKKIGDKCWISKSIFLNMKEQEKFSFIDIIFTRKNTLCFVYVDSRDKMILSTEFLESVAEKLDSCIY